MERVVRKTSLHPGVDEKLEKLAKKNGRKISNQIAVLVKNGVDDDCHFIRDLGEEVETQLLEAAKKENRDVDNVIETAIKVYLNRAEYVRVFR